MQSQENSPRDEEPLPRDEVHIVTRECINTLDKDWLEADTFDILDPQQHEMLQPVLEFVKRVKEFLNHPPTSNNYASQFANLEVFVASESRSALRENQITEPAIEVFFKQMNYEPMRYFRPIIQPDYFAEEDATAHTYEIEDDLVRIREVASEVIVVWLRQFPQDSENPTDYFAPELSENDDEDEDEVEDDDEELDVNTEGEEYEDLDADGEGDDDIDSEAETDDEF